MSECCTCTYFFVPPMFLVPVEVKKKASDLVELELMGGYESSCECWELIARAISTPNY